MKTLTILFCLLINFQLFAYDTSGCSLITKTQNHLTEKQASLKVTSSKAPRQDCWNISSSSFLIEYSWGQKFSTPQYNKVGFWIRINNQETYLHAQTISCATNNFIGYSHNTSSEETYICTAILDYTIGNIEDWNIEIAPEVDGAWDTIGYGNNYQFSL